MTKPKQNRRRRRRRRQRPIATDLKISAAEHNLVELCTNPFGNTRGGPYSYGDVTIPSYGAGTPTMMCFEAETTFDITTVNGDFALVWLNIYGADSGADLGLKLNYALDIDGAGDPTTTDTQSVGSSSILSSFTAESNFSVVATGLKVWSVGGTDDNSGVMSGTNTSFHFYDTTPEWYTQAATLNAVFPNSQYTCRDGITVRGVGDWRKQHSPADLENTNSYANGDFVLPAVYLTGLTSGQKIYCKAVFHIAVHPVEAAFPMYHTPSYIPVNEDLTFHLCNIGPMVAKGHSFYQQVVKGVTIVRNVAKRVGLVAKAVWDTAVEVEDFAGGFV